MLLRIHKTLFAHVPRATLIEPGPRMGQSTEPGLKRLHEEAGSDRVLSPSNPVLSPRINTNGGIPHPCLTAHRSLHWTAARAHRLLGTFQESRTRQTWVCLGLGEYKKCGGRPRTRIY